MLLELCGGSELRYRVLRTLLMSSDKMHLRALAAAAGVDPSNCQRLLQRLARAGLCRQFPPVDQTASGPTRPRYGADLANPLVHELRKVFLAAAAREPGANSQARLDEIKRETGELLLRRFSMAEIRRRSLANLERWRGNGAWCAAYAEWQGLLEHANDAILRYVMTSADEDCNRLRQSMPYVGILPREDVRALNEEIAA